MNKRYIIGIGIIVVCGVVAFSAFRGSLTPYVGFAEARQLDRPCQVMGAIDKENVRYDGQAGILYFTIIDEEGATLPVAYRGVTPGNFDQATSVVCQGQYQQGAFTASQLLVKCPSKYQGLEAAGEQNPHEAVYPADSA
ncbi:MAG TPA: cytochrome c maturation protein CcmE [Acidobacteriota bacterium]|nr:cytochrome c maturation protein CcmE [Acidobacteriota bacterium]